MTISRRHLFLALVLATLSWSQHALGQDEAPKPTDAAPPAPTNPAAPENAAAPEAAAPEAAAPATPLTFAGKLIGGSTTVNINGTKTDTITIYQFDDDFLAQNPTDTCEKYIPANGKPLNQTVSGKTTTTTAGTLSDNAPQAITMAAPIAAGTFLCLAQYDSNSKTTTYSTFQIVTDPNSHGRAVFDFTAGSVISNQQNNSSTTAAVYLDLGFIFDFARPGGGPKFQTVTKRAGLPDLVKPRKNFNTLRPGLEDFIDLRLTQVPVSTSTTTTTPATTTSSTFATPSDTSTTSTSTAAVQTVLTSQQSAVVYGGFDFPWRLTRWSKNTNSFIVAPLVKAGFNTLLNPTVKASSSTTTGDTPTATPTFNSLYWFHSYGMRLGWYKFPASTDDAPKSVAQLDMATGWFSNLPSNVCLKDKASSTILTTAPTGTSCFLSTTTSGTTTYQLDSSRTLVPRVRLDGFIKIPNTPAVIGVDANLAQYAYGHHLNQVDPLSKPGNDVRIYFGVSVDPLTVFKKVGLPY